MAADASKGQPASQLFDLDLSTQGSCTLKVTVAHVEVPSWAVALPLMFAGVIHLFQASV